MALARLVVAVVEWISLSLSLLYFRDSEYYLKLPYSCTYLYLSLIDRWADECEISVVVVCFLHSVDLSGGKGS